MTKEALAAARDKVAELVADLELNDDVVTLSRAVQEQFKTWMATRADVLHEVAQYFIRGQLHHIKKHRGEDDLSDFEKFRRERPKSFHGYESRDGERRFPRGRGL